MSKPIDPDAWPYPGSDAFETGSTTPPADQPSGSKPGAVSARNRRPESEAAAARSKVGGEGDGEEEVIDLTDSRDETLDDEDERSVSVDLDADADYDYEEDDERLESPKRDRSRSFNPEDEDEDDDYGSAYDDQYDDQYEDDFDEYGDGAGKPSKGKLIAAAVGALVFLAVFIGIAVSLLSGGDDVAAPAPTPTPTTAPQAAVPVPGQAPVEVMDSLRGGLAAWGQFALSGDLEAVRPFFLPGTRQFAQLERDAGAIAAARQPGPPLDVQLTAPTAVQTGDGNWVVTGTVTTSRPAERAAVMQMRIGLVRPEGSDRWQIATMQNLPRPTP